MSETTTAAPTAEKEADFGAPPTGIASRWKAEIEAFDRERKAYADRAEKITKRYRNEQGGDDRRFALLWANVEVLKPTVYARDPVPRVFRRFRDRDPVGRVASKLLERVLTCQIEKGGYGDAVRAAVLDFLTIAQGTVWAFFEPREYGERVTLGHVHWKDFGFTAGARTWAEVTAVWRVAYMTREELQRRFGEEAAKGVPLDRVPPETGAQPDADVIGKATVYEIWDSAKRQVIWLHKGVAEPLDVRPYPLRLRGLFPCPKPLFGTMTTGSTVPVPDFVYYQDQALELDDLTARIAALSKALKLIGFVPGDSQADIQKGLDSANEVALVPVEAWALGQGRPMDNAIAWLPVSEVAGAISRLIELREQVKSDAYEVTGLSDILRGSTQASETATAQQIKAQWGSVRVRERQQEVARFCRDAIEIMGDVVCGHFDPMTILAEANAEAFPEPDAPHLSQALALLKGPDALRAYRVDVETDSTIAPDELGERQAATDLLTGVSGYLNNAMPLISGVAQQKPEALQPVTEMVGGLLTMAVRRFRGGEDADELIERAMQALAQPAQPVAPVGPDPAAMAQAEAQAQAQAAQQAAAMDAQVKMQIETGKAEVQMRLKQMDIEAEDRREAARLQWEREKHAMEAALRQTEGSEAREIERMKVEGSQRETMEAVLTARQGELTATVAEPLRAEIQQIGAALGQTVEAITQVAGRAEAIAGQLAEVAEEISAPAEIMRGPDGRAMGLRRGKRVRAIKRGPDGRAMGIE